MAPDGIVLRESAGGAPNPIRIGAMLSLNLKQLLTLRRKDLTNTPVH